MGGSIERCLEGGEEYPCTAKMIHVVNSVVTESFLLRMGHGEGGGLPRSTS